MSQPDHGFLTKRRSRVTLPAIADASELSTSENEKHAPPLPTVAAPRASDLFKDLAFQKQALRKVHSMPSEADGTGLMTIPRLQDVNRASQKNDNKPKDSHKRLAKNYDNFVKDYNSLKPYARRRDGTFPSDTRCVFCKYHVPIIVFFPCQHKCVCNICLRSYDIGVDTSNPNTWTSCPVCMSDIRLVLPNDGREEDLYWHWVLEVEPMLPASLRTNSRPLDNN
ncbi:hypothetical protein Poli38472_003807 [Pythium oligandrum]|uniref:RING-type domain-containing protein n=1 Tax=Pythium oligandrum TaxID=41045 RepID=A0A8K1CP60_PYTOL|nr:hypothetical protein Poli38472_003807 [Pythium oligandrum]|eukprot:TMW66042.1 hypothetical protein Poli38472_003807 [Pythium oligandrum]